MNTLIITLAISITMTLNNGGRIIRPVEPVIIEQDAPEVVEVQPVQEAPVEVIPSFYDWVMYPSGGDGSFADCDIFIDKACADAHRLHTHGE